MTHEDAGHYGSKHPEGMVAHPSLVTGLTERAEDGRVTCTAAHQVAELFDVAPSEVGKAADLLEFRIIHCQMGLFGYSPEKRIVKAPAEISDDLRDRLQAAATDGRIGCAACWRIAKELGLGKLAVAGGCELLGLKVKDCQLGAF